MVAKKSTSEKSTAQGTAAGKRAGTAPAKTKAKAKTAGTSAKAGAPAKKAPAKKAAAKKAAAEKAAAEKAAAEKPVTKKTAAKKSAAKKTAAKKSAAKKSATTTGATPVVAKKAAGDRGTATKDGTAVPKARQTAAGPGELAVRPGEDPWTPEEVAEARAELTAEALRLRSEIESSEESLVGLMRDSQDGAGEDDADTGSKNITREHELGLAANAREVLLQTERALDRIEAGTYGICENCGNPIGKARMQAFPRATLCVECKQKQERRV
ncbi:TraR/DksA family transcriptional regulator [Streptomyces physcomitrii]|uniref:DNA-binding protein n=1 Tax=Streptomyces physcomitrii TaxID=2724184 RepID=A0ABX1H041_9ACTN|nr:TraR/DksA C4-type zinc finger protein [Streptomyces physcomitrii]NKI41392.1 DNA-binding protein [Streptomyces physcomitrii]